MHIEKINISGMDYRRQDMLEKHICKLMLIKNIDSLLRFTRKLKTGQSGVSAFV